MFDEDGRVNEQRLDNFVKDFQRVEGVLLEKEKIQKNPALRTIAKKLLNSLWGKLAQNDNSVVVDFLKDYEELVEMLNHNTLELTITNEYENFEKNTKQREEVMHVKGFSLTNRDAC